MLHIIYQVENNETTISASRRECLSRRKSSKVSRRLSYIPKHLVPPIGICKLFLQPQFYLVALMYPATRIFVNISQSYMSFFLQYTISLSSDYIATIPLIMYVSGFVVTFVNTWVTNKFGFTAAFVISSIVALGMQHQKHG